MTSLLIFLGALVLFMLALAGLWHAAANNEAALRQAWQDLLGRPPIAALRRRCAPQLSRLRARLAPAGYFGLQLTAGALLFIAAAWLFGGIAEDVFSGDPLTVADARLATWFHAHAVPRLTTAMLLISDLNGNVAITALLVMVAIHLTWQREWAWLAALLLTVPGGMLLNVALKLAFRRERPSFTDPILTLTSYSFPSGHVAGATLFYGFLTAYLVPKIPAWRWRVLAVLSACFGIALVALSRIYLGVHFLSDVLAAFAESIAWLALTLTAVHTLRQRRAAGVGSQRRRGGGPRRPPPPPERGRRIGASGSRGT